MYDCHSHTDFSGDCGTPPQEMILSAIQKKMKGIAITDHVDYDYPHDEPNFEIDLDGHFSAISALKQQESSNIFVAIGLEIGYQPSCEIKASQAVQSKAYDFILCSIHTLQGADLYYGNFFTTRTPLKALTDYFEALCNMLDSFSDFDAIGHLDLPRRYHKPINALAFSDYHSSLEKLLKKIIEKGKAIEFNTSGYRYNDNSPYPTFETAQLYYDLGGRKITLGSDAHRPEDIGHLFNETAEALKTIGFTEAYYYNQRKAIPYKL
jgi:histidinol-phosphatase (PHP family)